MQKEKHSMAAGSVRVIFPLQISLRYPNNGEGGRKDHIILLLRNANNVGEGHGELFLMRLRHHQNEIFPMRLF